MRLIEMKQNKNPGRVETLKADGYSVARGQGFLLLHSLPR